MRRFCCVLVVVLGLQGLAWADEASDWFAKAIGTKDLDLKIECYDKAIGAASRRPAVDQAILYNNRGVVFGMKGEYAKAIQDYAQALELNPGYEYAFNNLGSAHDQQGDFDQALHSYNQAIAINPKYANAYYNRANTHGHRKEYALAMQDYNQALELKREFPDAHIGRGEIFRAMGDYSHAIQDFTRAISLQSDSGEAHMERAITYRDMRDFQRAIQDLDRVIELEPGNVDAVCLRGKCYRDIENYSQAIENFDQAIVMSPDYASPYGSLAWLYATANDTRFRDGAKAVENAAKAVDLGETASRLDTLAAAYVQNQEPLKAMEVYRSVIAKDEAWLRRYQQSLRQKGYYQGEANGVYSQEFEQALRNCVQKGHHL